jgi:hypothetical protein
MLQLRHMPFRYGLLRERPGQHELGLEHRATGIDDVVQRRCDPFMDRVLNPPAGVTGVAFIPAPIEVLGDAGV